MQHILNMAWGDGEARIGTTLVRKPSKAVRDHGTRVP